MRDLRRPSELLSTFFDYKTMPVIESEDDEAADDPDEAADDPDEITIFFEHFQNKTNFKILLIAAIDIN